MKKSGKEGAGEGGNKYCCSVKKACHCLHWGDRWQSSKECWNAMWACLNEDCVKGTPRSRFLVS